MKKIITIVLTVLGLALTGMAQTYRTSFVFPTNTPPMPLYTQPLPATNTVSGTVSITGTPTVSLGTSTNVNAAVSGNIGGFTLVTNLTLAVDTTAGGIAANDVLAPQLEVANAVRTTGGTGILKCITLATGDNNSPGIRLLVTSQPITWPVTNAAANLTMSEASRILGISDFATTDFKAVGTNYFATKDVSIGIKAATNSIFFYAVCTGAITNSNSATINLTILQD